MLSSGAAQGLVLRELRQTRGLSPLSMSLRMAVSDSSGAMLWGHSAKLKNHRVVLGVRPGLLPRGSAVAVWQFLWASRVGQWEPFAVLIKSPADNRGASRAFIPGRAAL